MCQNKINKTCKEQLKSNNNPTQVIFFKQYEQLRWLWSLPPLLIFPRRKVDLHIYVTSTALANTSLSFAISTTTGVHTWCRAFCSQLSRDVLSQLFFALAMPQQAPGVTGTVFALPQDKTKVADALGHPNIKMGLGRSSQAVVSIPWVMCKLLLLCMYPAEHGARRFCCRHCHQCSYLSKLLLESAA